MATSRAITTTPAGIAIRIPRRPDKLLRRFADALRTDAATLREREAEARTAAANLDAVGADPRSSAAARGKAVAYKQAVDLITATLDRFA